MGPGRRHRDAQLADHVVEAFERLAQTHPGAGQHDRPPGRPQPAQDLADLIAQLFAVPARRVLGGVVTGQLVRVDLARLHVHGHVDPAGAGPSRRGQEQHPFQVVTNTLRVRDEDGVLGDAADHADDVHFLVAQLAQAGQPVGGHAGLALDLAGDHQHRDGVGPGAEDAVEGVDGAGAGGDVDHPDLAGDAGVALGRHRRRLLVVAANVAQAGFRAEGVVQEHRPAAGHQEHVAHAPVGQSTCDVVGHANRHDFLAPKRPRRPTADRPGLSQGWTVPAARGSRRRMAS